MDSMYDKLGELLNESLKAGQVKFKFIKKSETDSDETPDASSNTENPVEKNSSTQNSKNKESKSEEKLIYVFTEEQNRAVKVLGLNNPFTAEQLKNSYKEKLKYYHPDHWEKNQILKDIANKKTREIMDSYNLLSVLIGKK